MPYIPYVKKNESISSEPSDRANNILLVLIMLYLNILMFRVNMIALNGKLYVFSMIYRRIVGEAAVDIYDPLTETWSSSYHMHPYCSRLGKLSIENKYLFRYRVILYSKTNDDFLPMLSINHFVRLHTMDAFSSSAYIR